MLATGRSLSLVSALVALTLFVIMETSVVSSYPPYFTGADLARLKAILDKYRAQQQENATERANQGSTTTRPISAIDLPAEMDTNNASSPVNINATRLHEEKSGSSPTQAHRQIRDIRMNYGGYDYWPRENSGNSTMNSNYGNAQRAKIVWGNCHLGSLLYTHNLNLDVYRSSSVEADVPVSLDDSYCIKCVTAQPRNAIKATLSVAVSNGYPGGRNTVTVTATGSNCGYYEHLQIDVKVYQVRKRGPYCD